MILNEKEFFFEILVVFLEIGRFCVRFEGCGNAGRCCGLRG